jgi:hypothetical protein
MAWPTTPRRLLTLAAALVAAALAPAAPVRGQDATFQIHGVVRDRNDTPVAEMPVALTGSATGTTTTDAAGRWVFSGLAAGGTYTVTPTRPAFTVAPASQVFPTLARDVAATPFVVTRGVFTRYFAEGATGAVFTTEFALLNPTDVPAETTLTFQTPTGPPVPVPLTVAPHARATVDPATVPGLEATALATVITSTQPLVADRTMRWDARGYGSHTETSVAAPQTQWYLAEGATHSGFQLFYLLQNPQATPATVTVTYLRPAPAPPLVKAYPVAARSRVNIWVNLETFATPSGPQPLLAAAEVSAVFDSDVPVIVERAMYLTRAGRPFDAGHASAASPALATQWFLAEGATGAYFDLFALIANPTADAAEVAITYLLPASSFVKTYTVPAASRVTLWVDHEDPRLADTAVSLAVVATNGVPVLVERAMWWPGDGWFEGHTSRGATETGVRWALADGQVGGPSAAETYVLVANTSPFAADVQVTAHLEDGTTAARTYTVAATSRFTIPMGAFFPEIVDRRFGVVVESRPTGNGVARLVVERASYSDATLDGHVVHWAAGANAFGTRLQAEPPAPAAVDGDLLPLAAPAAAALAPVAVTADAQRAAQAVVGPAGGTVTTTAADGTRYTLTVPRGALPTPTAITLTPVTALTGVPVPVTLVAAVQGAPEGLRFARPATLTIELPAPPGLVLGLQVPTGGTGLTWTPVAQHGSTLTLPVPHFSTLAVPRTEAQLLTLLAGTTPFAQAMARLQTATTTWSPVDAAAVRDALVQWYDTDLSGHLLSAADVAATDAQRLAALAELYRWESLRSLVESLLGHLEVGGVRIRGQLTSRATEARGWAAAIVGHGYAAWNEPCRQHPGALLDRLRLADRAARFAVLALDYFAWLDAHQADPVEVDQAAAPNLATWGLSPSQIPASFCVVETLTVSEPALAPHATGQLRVTAGAVFGSEPPAVGDVMRVGFQPDPASYAGYRHARTTAAGEAYFPVTADATGQIRYRVCADFATPVEAASWVTLVYRLDGVNCRTAVTGVVVSPAQTTIAPGASRQFTVVVEGTPNQAVTWTVEGGGTITDTGRFTSNGTEGTFFVRATSVEDTDAVGVAQIRVSTTPPPPPVYPCLNEACTFVGTYTWCETRRTGEVCTPFASGTHFSHPVVDVDVYRSYDSPGTFDVRGTIHWTGQTGCTETTGFTTLESDGRFVGTGPQSGTNVCMFGRSLTGTLTVGHLEFTFVEWYQGVTISFTGTRVP